ncbi:HAD-IA family hydrolase [Methylocapsa acidiphila]|uniref:HAD-IA family hydrolase n=1 Tax=Methylocapsa acidiphila TaxID=133552 RepID=UPI0003FE5EA3|nr:HAD-IA family hydrolase [Methylocapsa acidiphila]
MTPHVSAFIFDLGNVLVRHDDELLYDRLAACCADPAAARPQLPSCLGDEDIGLGRLAVEALHARLAARHGFAETYPRFLELWSSHFSPEPGMDHVLRALAQNHRVILLSNTNAAHIAHIKENYPVFGRLHAAYLSYELGLMKPNPATYLKVLELEGLRPENCIFIDDRAENAAAAEALGMNAITFTGRDDLLARLDGFGILVPLKTLEAEDGVL